MTYVLQCCGCKTVREVQWPADELDSHKVESDDEYDHYHDRCEWCGVEDAIRRYTPPQSIIVDAKWSMTNAPWDSHNGSRWIEVPGYNGPGEPPTQEYQAEEAARQENIAEQVVWGSNMSDLAKNVKKKHGADISGKKEEVNVS